MNETPDADAIALAQQLLDDAREGNIERLTGYLDAGVPVELTDTAGNTLLMLAAYHGHASTVAALIERGALVDAINDRGQSPIAGALFKGWSLCCWVPMPISMWALRRAEPLLRCSIAQTCWMAAERPQWGCSPTGRVGGGPERGRLDPT